MAPGIVGDGWFPNGGGASTLPRKRDPQMSPAMSSAVSSAAIYARVSSARQKEQQTIDSQIAALHAHAEQLGLEVAPQWVFSDDGHSGATLVRPALEKLRDWQPRCRWTWCSSIPDRLARKHAYQALLIEELAKGNVGRGRSSSWVHRTEEPRGCWPSCRAGDLVPPI